MKNCGRMECRGCPRLRINKFLSLQNESKMHKTVVNRTAAKKDNEIRVSRGHHRCGSYHGPWWWPWTSRDGLWPPGSATSRTLHFGASFGPRVLLRCVRVGSFWAYFAISLIHMASKLSSNHMLGACKVKIYEKHSKQAKLHIIEEIGV